MPRASKISGRFPSHMHVFPSFAPFCFMLSLRTMMHALVCGFVASLASTGICGAKGEVPFGRLWCPKGVALLVSKGVTAWHLYPPPPLVIATPL